MKNHIKKSASKAQRSVGEYLIFNKITVYTKDALPDGVDIVEAISLLEQRLPERLEYDVEEVMIGEFDFLQMREVDSVYENGAIYVTNQQDSTMDLVDDLTHEFAHALEYRYGDVLYSDKRLANEYLGKKQRVLDLLEREGFTVKPEWYSATEYDEEFDSFLFREVTYPVLVPFVQEQLTNPYALVALREYFASGFEDFFGDNKEYLEQVSPMLYSKINQLT